MDRSSSDGAPAKPWQEIVMPSAAEVAAGFDSPPPEYGLVLWWGWNGPMTEVVIARDLDAIRARGVRNVMIEAGYEMAEPYLSPGWFERVRLAVEQARQRDMRVYLVDEGKYPSGFAGGKFSAERPDLRMQALAIAERIGVSAGETLSRSLPSQVVGALAVNLEDETSRALEVRGGDLDWTAPPGTWEVWLIEHQFRTSLTRAVSNPTRGKDAANSLCDYLNPAATQQFMAYTHEQYTDAIGEEFGRTVLGFRGDEPDYAHTPWTPDLTAEFERRKGYDVRPFLASFFAPRLTLQVQRAKADYWDVWSDLFRDRFFRIQAEWCAAHGLAYLVHLNHEDKMAALTRSEGDFFKAMRHVQVPGVDTIWNQIWPGQVADFPKLASSAAHLYGRPRAFSESFAAYRVRPTVDQAKWVIDHQFVRGINMLEVMFYLSSASGQAPRSGWMASNTFPALAAYVHRASYLLSMGQPTAQIALYTPTSSLWLGGEAADTNAWELARQLLERQCDFDWTDEEALASFLTLEGGELRNLSGGGYRAVLIPSASVLSEATLARLQAFAAAGGRVILVGRKPSLVVRTSFLAAAGPGDLSWALWEPTGDLTPQVLEALPPPDVALEPPCPAVKALHRRWRDADLYMIFNESGAEQVRQAALAGWGQPQVWGPASGRIETLPDARPEDGCVRLPLALAPYEAKYLVIGAQLNG